MALTFPSLAALRDHGFDALIDVRSPAEFAEDHVPGAISLPVLSNEERARVGTIYTQEAPFTARKIGAALVARNAAAHIEGPLADKDGGWRPLVYCWRGGQRSGSFASILQQIGWRAEVIEGGYRSYRRLVVAAMHDTVLPHRLVLIDGNTGTAKTEILHRLARRGVQVVDLEGLAAHRGSVFGPVAKPQPSQKAFEGALAAAFDGLDPAPCRRGRGRIQQDRQCRRATLGLGGDARGPAAAPVRPAGRPGGVPGAGLCRYHRRCGRLAGDA